MGLLGVTSSPSGERRAGGAAGSGTLRAVLLTSAGATLLGLLVTVGGLWLVPPGVSPLPRFWATVFFVLLLWPVGLSLLGLMTGVRGQRAGAALLLLAAVGQHASPGAMPLPERVRWHATLASPGDAVRQRILLPPASDARWTRAWREASAVVVAVCSGGLIPPEAGMSVILNDGPAVALATLPRAGPPNEDGWYLLPVGRGTIGGGVLDVVVRRDGAAGGPVRICGGQDDPSRPGAGGAQRRRGGTWSAEGLADQPLPPVDGGPPLSRYYVELRFLGPSGRPTVAIYF